MRLFVYVHVNEYIVIASERHRDARGSFHQGVGREGQEEPTLSLQLTSTAQTARPRVHKVRIEARRCSLGSDLLHVETSELLFNQKNVKGSRNLHL